VTIGLLATAGQLLMTYAFQHVTVSSGSLLMMLAPALNILAGILFFREPVTALSLVGIAAVLAGCTYVVVRR
jgi:drug/metabolite transporter (DMT)-like permease